METEELPNVVSIPATNPLSLCARLEAAAGRQPSPSNKSTPKNPIDKYTKPPSDSMLLIHSTSPTAALENIDLDLISFWEQAEGGKLLAHPFDNEARFPELHEDIKNRIFTAVAEITGSQSVSISAPRPSEEAIRKDHTPTTFLIYNLTPEQHELLLQCRVWSSLAITFLVTDLSPPCPRFLFSIKGFSTLTNEGIWTLVRQVWSDNDTLAFIENLMNGMPDDIIQDAYMSAHSFLGSLHIFCLNVKDAGDTLTPCFNTILPPTPTSPPCTDKASSTQNHTTAAFAMVLTTPAGSAPSQPSKDGMAPRDAMTKPTTKAEEPGPELYTT
ncbi:hypothetical protein EDB83DRAFT_2521288 [Lactarius deliciosus]|nr:hypothetical protein EDB83DRAFT_2521288 [Lactarius deliciosus]